MTKNVICHLIFVIFNVICTVPDFCDLQCDMSPDFCDRKCDMWSDFCDRKFDMSPAFATEHVKCRLIFVTENVTCYLVFGSRLKALKFWLRLASVVWLRMERVISLSARIFRGFFFPAEVKEYTAKKCKK